MTRYRKGIAESLLNSNALTGDIPSEIKDIHLDLLSKQSSEAVSSVQPIQKLNYIRVKDVGGLKHP